MNDSALSPNASIQLIRNGHTSVDKISGHAESRLFYCFTGVFRENDLKEVARQCRFVLSFSNPCHTIFLSYNYVFSRVILPS